MTTATANDFARAYNRYEACCTVYDAAESFAIDNPESEEAERVWDEAYNDKWYAFNDLVAIIVEIVKPHISDFDEKAARKMLMSGEDRVRRIVRMMAA